MALASWKAFQFFDSSLVNLQNSESASLFEQGRNACISSGSDNLFIGGSDGVVRILSRSFKVVGAFQASDKGSITHLKQARGTALLVTIAEDLSTEPVLKVWGLDKLEKKTGTPRCLSTVTVHNGRKKFPVSAFAALDDLSQLAVGFANGSVTVIRGDLIHDLGTKQRTVFETEEPISGIEFRQSGLTILYIATTGRISTLVLSGKGQGQPPRSLDESGCAVNCMVVDRSSHDVVVARDDAVYYYGYNGRGPYYACAGRKRMISLFKQYVVLVSSQNKSANNKTKRSHGGLNGSHKIDAEFQLTILDLDLHFVAHQESLSSAPLAIFAEWGDLFAVTVDGKLLRYHERTYQQNIDLLCQRRLYVLAINLAQRDGLDVSLQNEIYRNYGDHLYQKGDYDTAMQQYLKAIENTQPSQVIRKFLDTQRIQNLISYLEELHEHHMADSDHTTLLLNCYAKLKDVEKLERFIKSPGNLRFDTDTAISMCRQGGFFDQAAYLARKHDEHDLVVDILIDDSKKYAEALAYIWRLEPESSLRCLMKYATVLLQNCPKECTEILIDFYTGKFKPTRDAVVVVTAPINSGTSLATTAVQNLAALIPLPYMNSSSDPKSEVAGKDTKVHAQVIQTNGDDPPAVYDIPDVKNAFPIFVNHVDEFIIFLEACSESGVTLSDENSDLHTTLFEMYLRKAGESGDGEKEQWEARAKRLIEDGKVPVDRPSVLLLSHMENFRDGTMLVRERQGLHFDIFRSCALAKDTAGAIQALKKYGPEDPQLYPTALAYFTSSTRVVEEAGDEIERVLSKIDEDGLMAPLQVIQMLSATGVATVGMIRKYMRRTIDRERQEIETNRQTISTYRADTAARRAEYERLATEPVTFTATRCSACGAQLDLPTVHFMCKHSFHERCLNTPMNGRAGRGEVGGNEQGGEDAEVECPVCEPGNATVRAIRQAQLESADRHDLFVEELSTSTDRFATVTEWFGRGVMGAGSAAVGSEDRV